MSVTGPSKTSRRRFLKARPASKPCVHRSKEPAGSVSCKSCGNSSVKRDVYQCSKFEEEVLTHPYSGGYRACSKCSDYKAK